MCASDEHEEDPVSTETARTGIVSYGTYLPFHRLRRSEIVAALGAGGGKGTRTVASYDEDTTSMGVEAARRALARVGGGSAPESLYFATADPPYLDKSNASAIAAALGCPEGVFAADLCGSARSGIAALRVASDDPALALAILSDIRTGLPGGSDETEGGDAAAAFCLGTGDEVIAEVVARSATTAELLDRWRLPGRRSSMRWEERFGELAYSSLAEEAFSVAMRRAEIAPEEVGCVVVAGLHRRAVRRVRSILGNLGAKVDDDDLSANVGNTGTAHAGLLLAAALDSTGPDQLIAVVALADGVDVLVLRTTDAIGRYGPVSTVAEQVRGGSDRISYATFLSWRGMLPREPPRRPEPQRPAAPPSRRNEKWKFGFAGSRCEECGTRHLPPARVCLRCGTADRMATERLADVKGTVATFTIDHLAYSPSPPMIVAVIDFDGGGRFECELTDVDPEQVAIGDRVEMTFRKLFNAEGVRDYFWKARPIREVQ